MIFNKGQNNACKSGKKWFKKQDEQVFKLVGPAGSGKTTVIMSIVDAIGLDSNEEVLFVTFVGKAALVLRRNGLLGQTIHSAIYKLDFEIQYDINGQPERYPNGKIVKKFRFVKRDSLQSHKIKLIVVDEAGMVNEDMQRDLESFGVPIIAIGDEDQLPPVFGKSKFLQNPQAVLDEIVRQKQGDPIVYISYLARKGLDIPLGQYGPRCFVVDESILKYKELYLKPDIVICGKNKTRDKINNIVRHDIKGIEDDMPVDGDKLVCRKNNWTTVINGDIPLINGLFGYVDHVYYESFNGHKLNIDFRPEFLEYKCFEEVALDFDYLNMSREDKKNYNSMFNKNGNLFEYGYASTCHLVQGSQFDYTMVLEEHMGNKDFQKKLMYTSVTRSKKALVLVKQTPKTKSSFFW